MHEPASPLAGAPVGLTSPGQAPIRLLHEAAHLRLVAPPGPNLRDAVMDALAAAPDAAAKLRGQALRVDLGDAPPDPLTLRRLGVALRVEHQCTLVAVELSAEALRRFAEQQLHLIVATPGAAPADPLELPPEPPAADAPPEAPAADLPAAGVPAPRARWARRRYRAPRAVTAGPRGALPAPAEAADPVGPPAEPSPLAVPEAALPAPGQFDTSLSVPVAPEALPTPVEPEAELPAPVEPEAELPAPVEPEAELPAPVEPESELPAPVEPEAALPAPPDAAPPDAAPVEEAPTSPAIPLAALTVGPAFDDGDDDPDAEWGDSEAPALPLQPVPTSTEPDPTRKVTPVRRTLRSGHRVRAPGDVIVYGDVNAGALVEAGGNIIVLGALRGLAHAGVSGARDAVVLAFDLRPAQVRIADTIAFPEGADPARARSSLLTLLDRARGAEPARSGGPEVARLVGGAIVIEPFRGRFPG